MAEQYLHIPSDLKIGFKSETDNLSYITYIKENGTIAKETSWNSWRHKCEKVLDIKNDPISGLYIKCGGGGHRWSHRQAWCQIVDPRGFEFQISYDNLLFILSMYSYNITDEANKFEGEFVYAWDGANLVLLPIKSEDYTYTVNVNTKKMYQPKDCVIGNSYIDPKTHTIYEFLGIYNVPVVTSKSYWYGNKSYIYNVCIKKRYLFKVKTTYNKIGSITDLPATRAQSFIFHEKGIYTTQEIEELMKQYYTSCTSFPLLSMNTKFKPTLFAIPDNCKEYHADLISVKTSDEWTHAFIYNGCNCLLNHGIAISDDKKTVYIINILERLKVGAYHFSNSVFCYKNQYNIKTDEDAENYIKQHAKYIKCIEIVSKYNIVDNKVEAERISKYNAELRDLSGLTVYTGDIHDVLVTDGMQYTKFYNI